LDDETIQRFIQACPDNAVWDEWTEPLRAAIIARLDPWLCAEEAQIAELREKIDQHRQRLLKARSWSEVDDVLYAMAPRNARGTLTEEQVETDPRFQHLLSGDYYQRGHKDDV
jgi:hypothetical protein